MKNNKLMLLARLAIVLLCLVGWERLQAQCVVINEILINPSDSNDGQNSPNTSEWIEFYNTCSTPVDISCYAFSDGDFTVVIPPGTIMQPYSFYVVGSNNSNVTLNLNWATCNCTTQNGSDQVGIFGNSNEQVVLHNSAGVQQDAIYWGSGQAFSVPPTSTATGCAAMTFNYSVTTITNTFENIGGAGGDGCGKARACDGSNTWVEICVTGGTPGATNNTETPSISISASTTDICAGECVNFSYTGTGSPTQYAWTFEGSSTGSSISAGPFGICYPTAGDYDVTLTVTTACGPFTQAFADFIHVSATGAVTITANGPTTFCTGGSVELQTTATGPYQWNLNNNPITGATSATYIAQQAGSYTVTTTGSCGGTSNAIAVTIASGLQLVIAANGPVNICNGQSVELAVNGTYQTYQWYLGANPIAGATGATYTATQSGNYTVQVTDQGCSGTSNVIQVTSTVVMAPPLTQDFSECEGQSVTLQVSNIYDSYQWLNNGNPITGATNAVYTFTLTNTVNISVTVTDHLCEATSAAITITSIPIPQVSISPAQDVQICQSSYTLTATTTGASIQWLNNGVPIPGATNTTYVVTDDGTYSFRSTSATGNCISTSNAVTVILESELDVDIQASALEACDGQTVTLSVDGNYDNITWSTNSTASSIQITSSGTYTVTVNNGGCTATDQVSILFHPMPVANAGNDTIMDCENGVVLVGTGTGTLSWLPNPALTPGLNPAVVTAYPNQTMYFTLQAVIGSCVATDQVLVEVDCNSIYIPNIFTPNGDGMNDYFEVKVTGAKHFHLRVFNRWGEMLFESTDPKKMWNGGKQDYYAPDGVYFWTLEVLDFQNNPLKDNGNLQGHVTLVR
jgi:gliding motility-associated-like protein